MARGGRTLSLSLPLLLFLFPSVSPPSTRSNDVERSSCLRLSFSLGFFSSSLFLAVSLSSQLRLSHFVPLYSVPRQDSLVRRQMLVSFFQRDGADEGYGCIYHRVLDTIYRCEQQQSVLRTRRRRTQRRLGATREKRIIRVRRGVPVARLQHAHGSIRGARLGFGLARCGATRSNAGTVRRARR